MANLLITLSVSLISVLAFIAYKHPNGYKRISLPVRGVVLIICSWLLLWNKAVEVTYDKIYKFVPIDKMDSAKEQYFSLLVLDHSTITIIMFVSIFYLAILEFLPVILDLPNSTK